MINKFYLASITCTSVGSLFLASSVWTSGQKDLAQHERISKTKQAYAIKSAKVKEEKAFADVRAQNQMVRPSKKWALNRYKYNSADPVFPSMFDRQWLNNLGNNSPDGIAVVLDSSHLCVGVSLSSDSPGKDGRFYFLGSKDPAVASYAKSMCQEHG
ncbi:hypothetical protein BJP34_35600 (plasmid) [Moorena producens PAL-8-15-08-1]|uniref:Uncharacterized protein n=1 Tax=Moorena producens PAL-8-15-08-1 TaxID=1458985 RepID=A0A1D8U486_9CYAN|nr:hypothetical protein [Moorena producens]AOX04710.1 hypothetical protein BJP34_35600 [Moorena producens PAL-8-15-08-1]NEO44329.1 hypothetical protein [Moorena sp. SIO4A3]